MNEWMNEQLNENHDGKAWEVNGLKKNIGIIGFARFQHLPDGQTNQPTNQPTDRRDLLSVDTGAHQNHLNYTTNGRLVSYCVKCNGGTFMQLSHSLAPPYIPISLVRNAGINLGSFSLK